MAYALSGGAAVLSASSADAEIIWSGIQNIGVASQGYPNTGNVVQIHVDPTDVTSTAFEFGWQQSGQSGVVAQAASGSNISFAKASQYNSVNLAAQFPYGAPVPGSWAMKSSVFLGVYDESNARVAGNWSAGVGGYVGFTFVDGLSEQHNGWMEVVVPSTSAIGENATLVQWAYESTPSTAIAAGALPATVPEIDASGAATASAMAVAGIALLEQIGVASGARGMRAWRRRRRLPA